MFVLLFGLMGVAAIFPVGNHYAAKGDRMDRGAALANVAFTELKARGMLDPNNWVYADGRPVIDASTGNFTKGSKNPLGAPDNQGHVFIIDPIGSVDAVTAVIPTGDPMGNFFPYGGENGGGNPWRTGSLGQVVSGFGWPVRRCSMLKQIGLSVVNAPNLNNRLSQTAAESIFRLRDDATVDVPRDADSPGVQRWRLNDSGTPNNSSDDFPMSRSYAGNYSWMAMILPVSDDSKGGTTGQSVDRQNPNTTNALLGLQPSSRYFGTFLYEASVIVFHKREPLPVVDRSQEVQSTSPERVLPAQIKAGGELIMYSTQTQGGGGVASEPADFVDLALDGIGAGQWVAVAGVNPNNGRFLVRWYRLLSVDDETDENPPQGTLDTRGLNGKPAVRRAMLAGPEWPQPSVATPAAALPLRVILVPGIVSVTTQTLKLDAGLPATTNLTGGKGPQY